jgi:hypothetical protein
LYVTAESCTCLVVWRSTRNVVTKEMNSADYVGQTVWSHIILWNDMPFSVVWVAPITHSPLYVATIAIRIICITQSLLPWCRTHPSRSLRADVLVKTLKNKHVGDGGETDKDKNKQWMEKKTGEWNTKDTKVWTGEKIEENRKNKLTRIRRI